MLHQLWVRLGLAWSCGKRAAGPLLESVTEDLVQPSTGTGSGQVTARRSSPCTQTEAFQASWNHVTRDKLSEGQANHTADLEQPRGQAMAW